MEKTKEQIKDLIDKNDFRKMYVSYEETIDENGNHTTSRISIVLSL